MPWEQPCESQPDVKILHTCCSQDPYQLEQYLKHNTFLADINNDRGAKNPEYAENLASLKRLVLFRFKDDVTVVPRDSAWFGFYNGSVLLTMQQTQLYQVTLPR